VARIFRLMIKPRTPCIGICSTVFGDEVCRGCKRFVHEVIGWNAYDDEQKVLVLDRLGKFTVQVVSGKIQVLDAVRFTESLDVVGLEYRRPVEITILDFLRKTAKQIRQLSDHGLQPFPDYRNASAEEIKLMIEDEILILSQATYNRSFKRTFAPLQQQTDAIESNRQSDFSSEEPLRETSRI